jgi:hypothetical protein
VVVVIWLNVDVGVVTVIEKDRFLSIEVVTTLEEVEEAEIEFDSSSCKVVLLLLLLVDDSVVVVEVADAEEEIEDDDSTIVHC